MNPFKVGDTVKVANAYEFSALNIARPSKFQDAEQIHVVTCVKGDLIGFSDFYGVDWYSRRFVKVEPISVKGEGDMPVAITDPVQYVAPNFNGARKATWDKYAESRVRSGKVVSPARQDGFLEGFAQGYAIATADAKARYMNVMDVAKARSTDPATSKEAAKGVKVGKLVDRILESLRDQGPGTAETIAQRLSVKLNSISPRFAPLKRQGIVFVISGEGGRSVYSFYPTSAIA